MTKLRSRLRRQLTLANLLAGLALFFALGGVGYAAATINGAKIVTHSIGAGKLKNGTLTSAQVKADGLTGGAIDESTLATVPAAQTAQTANSATTAQSLDGLTAAELQVSCQPHTSLYGGMCWDDEVRPLEPWIDAAIECAEDGGRLPSLSELIAYVAQPGVQSPLESWSADVIDLPGGKEHVLTRDETTTASRESTPLTFGFRCVFYRAN